MRLTALLIGLIAALLLLADITSLQAAETLDGVIARSHLERKARKMLYLEQFAELEALAREFRSTKAKFADGTWKLRYFYEGLYHPKADTDDEWQTLLTKIDSWRKKYPGSVTANVATANALYAFGWYARGQGYSRTVTAEGWKLLAQRREMARQELHTLSVSSVTDCPERHLLLVRLAKTDGSDRNMYESIFQKAIVFEPSYYDYYLAKADYLLPRWHGEEGDWQRFAFEIAQRVPSQEGKLLYARILGSMWRTGEFKSFKENGISWDLLKQGYQELERRYPDSAWNLNNFCRFACLAGDKETARALFARIGDHPYLEAWSGLNEFEKWRAWAGVGDRVEVDHFTGTEDFRQLLKLAQEGDSVAQFEVGKRYSARSEREAFNNQQAVKWLRKTAEQGLPEAQWFLSSKYTGIRGVARDDDEVRKWIFAAAYQGHSEAQYWLVSAYRRGQNGVPKDLVKAYAWLLLTGHSGSLFGEIEEQLTQEQLEQAHREAAEIRKTIQTNIAKQVEWLPKNREKSRSML